MRVGAIDCGTNSIRLLVADISAGVLVDVDRRMTIVRLGEGVDRTGSFSQAALERLCTGYWPAVYTFILRRGNAPEAAEDLTQRKPNPWFVRAVGTSAQPNHPLGEYAAKTLNYKRIAIVARKRIAGTPSSDSSG